MAGRNVIQRDTYISEPVLSYFYSSKEVESVLPLFPDSIFVHIFTST